MYMYIYARVSKSLTYDHDHGILNYSAQTLTERETKWASNNCKPFDGERVELSTQVSLHAHVSNH